MDKLVQKQNLTADGRDWLTLALDPFHDLDHPVAGYPDADTSKTVVSCYQYAYDVSKPASVNTQSWSAHVFSLPFSGEDAPIETTTGQTDVTGSTLQPTAPMKYNGRGLLNIEINNDASSLFPYNNASANMATRTAYPLLASHPFTKGSASRVIGMGFEIIDTSADLYKQGAITAYRMPQMPGNTQLMVSEPAYIYQQNMSAYHTPPIYPSEAMKLQGTRQWQMAEGAYVVCTQSSVDNKLKVPGHHGAVLHSGAFSMDYAEYSSANIGIVNAPPVPSAAAPKATFTCPFNTSGIMMTGLNSNSTFRVKLKIYVETAPLPWQSDLVVLASPSAPYDPATLEAYSKLLTHVPVAVVASDNGFGDWFAGIASVLSKIALPISAALSPIFPMAPLFGGVIGEVANTANRIMTGQKKNDDLTPGPQSVKMKDIQNGVRTLNRKARFAIARKNLQGKVKK